MIELLTCSDEGLAVRVDGRALALSWRWLRDHARDDASYLAASNQRIVTPDATATAGPGMASSDGATLTVEWTSGPTASFTEGFLASLGDPATMYATADRAHTPWVGDELAARIARIDGADIFTDNGIASALAGLARDGVITIENVPTDTSSTRLILECFGYVRNTIFGDVWEFDAENLDGNGYDDSSSTPLEITPHTDGTYSNDAPGLLALHCHIYRASGGENVLVDGRALAARLAEEAPDHFEVLTTVDIPGQYIGDGAHLVAHRPALRYDGDRFLQISYNHHDRAPFVLPEPSMSDLYSALHHVDKLANDRARQFELALRPGDMVILDNWRLLHGRRAFTGSRRMAGGYINREDVDSMMRRRSGQFA